MMYLLKEDDGSTTGGGTINPSPTPKPKLAGVSSPEEPVTEESAGEAEPQSEESV